MEEINYVQLWGWRNICEYLDSQWYKFAQIHEIKRDCRHCLPIIYQPTIKTHRQLLFERYLIQLIHYTQHPILQYQDSRRNRRLYKDCWGWQLCRDWEYKIDYLEKIVLFGYEPTIKPWETDLRLRIARREQREARKQALKKLQSMLPEQAKQFAKELNICFNCAAPIPHLMLNCVECGTSVDY